MSTKHTPGPWAYDKVTGEVYRDDGDVCPMIANVYRDNTSDTQSDADGRIIAAAPELLEAARWLLALIDGGEAMPKPGDVVTEALRSAVAKTKA